MKYFKVMNLAGAKFECGSTKGWARLRIDYQTRSAQFDIIGCICHNTLPPDAGVIGEYLDRPYPEDPMPLMDEEARKQWKSRNFIRNYATESYRRPPEL